MSHPNQYSPATIGRVVLVFEHDGIHPIMHELARVIGGDKLK